MYTGFLQENSILDDASGWHLAGFIVLQAMKFATHFPQILWKFAISLYLCCPNFRKMWASKKRLLLCEIINFIFDILL